MIIASEWTLFWWDWLVIAELALVVVGGVLWSLKKARQWDKEDIAEGD